MAIINCPECSKEISDKAPACPQCGSPTNFNEKNQIHPSINQDVKYSTNKASFFHRLTTGNCVPAKWILEWIAFYDTFFEIKTRNGSQYKFTYSDCKVTDSVLGRIGTVTLLIKSTNSKQKVRLHILYPEELQEGEVNDIKKRLNVGLRTGLFG